MEGFGHRIFRSSPRKQGPGVLASNATPARKTWVPASAGMSGELAPYDSVAIAERSNSISSPGAALMHLHRPQRVLQQGAADGDEVELAALQPRTNSSSEAGLEASPP